VRIRDRCNDREAQPGSGGIAGSAAEAFEGTRDEVHGETFSLVGDVQLEGA
jgi:hypothetical protein